MKFKVNKKVLFTLLIAIMMVTWPVYMAMTQSTISAKPPAMKIESVYDRLLTPQEKISILRTGRMLIEYIHAGGPDAAEKRAVYENFVARFKDFVVLEVVEIQQANETVDQMISPTGDLIPMGNVTQESLLTTFCEKTLVQPKECLLGSI